MTNSKPRTSRMIGCLLLIISAMIGGGIFTLPIMAFKLGIIGTVILTIIIYIIMGIAGMMVVEVCTKLPKYRNHYSSLAEAAYGKTGRILGLIAFSIAIYAALAAYISSSSTLIGSSSIRGGSIQNISPTIIELIFTVILSAIIISSIKYSEQINRIVMSIKIICLVTVVTLLSQYIEIRNLFIIPLDLTNLVQVLLIIILAFSYQSILPSIVNYIGPEHKHTIKKIIIYGVTITCVIYILWIIAMAGFINNAGAKQAFQENPNLNELVSIIKENTDNSSVIMFLNIFLNITLIASFLTIALAFLDFWIDALKLDTSIKGRLVAGFIAIVPPLIVAIFFSKSIFVLALAVSGFAGFGYSVLLPSSVAYKLYDKYNSEGSYFFGGGKNLRLCFMIFSIIFMILAIIF